MLESITLRFTEQPELSLKARGITVFVGPNNSGKSLVLREIEQIFLQDPMPGDRKLLKDFVMSWPAQDEGVQFVERIAASTPQPPSMAEGYVAVGSVTPGHGQQVLPLFRDAIRNVLNEKANKGWWATQVLRWGVVRLDGRSRFDLTNDQSGGDLLAGPSNTLSHLFRNDGARKKVQELMLEAFGLYYVIDPTNLGSLRIRMSRVPPMFDEQSLNAVARDYYRTATHIKEASDGVQAYAGIITAVQSGDFHTVLVDEPEAFLHPPLARKLGKHLASLAIANDGALFASTHSSDFLMGCVQAGKSVRVVRLEYSEGKSRGRVVDPEQLDAFLKRPLMRSANVVSALFHDGVVVTESDNDRAFYSEVYFRLAQQNPSFPSILFINAQNKQTIKDIIGPLRQFGVPAAAIVDIDVIKEGGKSWTDWLVAAHVPTAAQDGYRASRQSVKSCFEKNTEDMKIRGIGALNAQDRAAAAELFDSLDGYGLFAVRLGEVEGWLSGLAVPGKKTDWAVAMLERMGSDPAAPGYVFPEAGDVWDFMRRIVAWIGDTARKGIS